jgi:FkbM family methyltransferase
METIFDLGVHKGEDAEFYLKKGYKVVGVDANADLCQEVRDRLRDFADQLVIINAAIAREPGEVTFYRNESTVWGTTMPDWAERNARRGFGNTAERVKAITMAELIDRFGAPFYCKIDIEGADLIALEGLRDHEERPPYVSIESDKDSFRELRREISLLKSLGYDRFKIVPQRIVHKQKLPIPAKHGHSIRHQFTFGSSGAFGEEAPGRWMTAEETIEAYRPIFLRYALTGYDPFVRSRVIRKLLRLSGFNAGWFDTHARHASAA